MYFGEIDMKLTKFSQIEYSRVLDINCARSKGLSQFECENILIEAGASAMQAKNGAYVYLHHGSSISATRKASQSEYEELINNFGGKEKESKDCIQYLEKMGFSYGQAKTAVYKYRVKNGLIGK